jgi:hypothetical protein
MPLAGRAATIAPTGVHDERIIAVEFEGWLRARKEKAGRG